LIKKQKKLVFFLIFVCSFGFSLVHYLNIDFVEFNNNSNVENILHLSGEPDLAEEWNVTWGTGGYGTGIALDNLNNFYLSGVMSNDLCLVKFDLNGNYIWNVTWGDIYRDFGSDTEVDSFEDVYIAGNIGTSDFADIRDFCLVKYNSFGIKQWNLTWGNINDDEECRGLEIDTSGNIYLAGDRDSTTIWLLKYNISGNFKWARSWGPGFSRDIEQDSSGDIYIAGSTDSYGAESYDMCLLKYNSSGDLQWYKLWGGNSPDYGQEVAIDSAGNIYVAGITSSFGGIDDDVCLVKYNSAGIQQWNLTWGGSGRDTCYGIALDSSNNIYLTGRSWNVNNLFLLKVDSQGILQWNFTWGGYHNTWGSDIALDSSDNVYIVGSMGTILLVKFSSVPKITILAPNQNQLCGKTAPAFELSIFEPDLDTTWYTLDDGITNIIFNGLNGTINQIEWDKKEVGLVTIRFYANDTLGNVGYSEVVVEKVDEPGNQGILGYNVIILVGAVALISVIVIGNKLKKN